MDSSSKNQFQHTLNLPQTTFSIRANAQIKEPEILKNWEQNGIFAAVTECNSQQDKKFILHEGPPYANGHLHIGHALTYILKDIMSKAKRMDGYYAPLVPGWDCHGLPIELKVAANNALEADPVLFKQHCREFVKSWIRIQELELKNFGKIADYEHAYFTMSPEYEADTLRAFATFVEKGHINRKLKTVPWCASCRTVLATAEIEYQDRVDPSIYVYFALPVQVIQTVLPFLYEKNPDLHIGFAIWTTTPWSLPLNRAVVLNPQAIYSVIQGPRQGQAIIVAHDLAQIVCKKLGIEYVELAQADAIAFEGIFVSHPFINLMVPVLLDEMVQMNEGTACLSSAPGCGPEDYLFGLKHKLEIYSPISESGKYTKGIVPLDFEGMSVKDGQEKILQLLETHGTLIYKTTISHSYPHCWRCHKGLIFRATRQWFCDLSKNDLVNETLKEIENIAFVPERGRARLHSFIANRTEWCISRQRRWGVPILAVICTMCEGAFLDADFIKKVSDFVQKEGIEFWDKQTPELLQKNGLLAKDFSCESCENNNIQQYRLERDILDVWFDSGVSNFAVLKNSARLGVPADAYWEGSDQHRGWFQSSLLCGMVLYGHAPMKTIVTHGFIVDQQKRKMSKSLGNGVEPKDVITKYSRDVLRLWVASADFEDDLVMSDGVLANVAEMYKKIRNTMRFMLANIYDFNIEKDAVSFENMLPLDQYALAKLFDVQVAIQELYSKFKFSSIVQTFNTYCTNDLSALYLDILKDRLYTEASDSILRRSAQTALFYILDALTKLSAPILSFLAEEVSDFYQSGKKGSIHTSRFADAIDIWRVLADQGGTSKLLLEVQTDSTNGLLQKNYMLEQWQILEIMRDIVLKAIEHKRVLGIIKHSYEAKVTLWVDPTSREGLIIKNLFQNKHMQDQFFKDWFVVSQVVFAQSSDGLVQSNISSVYSLIEHASGMKCPRCWHWEETSNVDGLCCRCYAVLKK